MLIQVRPSSPKKRPKKQQSKNTFPARFRIIKDPQSGTWKTGQSSGGRVGFDRSLSVPMGSRLNTGYHLAGKEEYNETETVPKIERLTDSEQDEPYNESTEHIDTDESTNAEKHQRFTAEQRSGISTSGKTSAKGRRLKPVAYFEHEEYGDGNDMEKARHKRQCRRKKISYEEVDFDSEDYSDQNSPDLDDWEPDEVDYEVDDDSSAFTEASSADERVKIRPNKTRSLLFKRSISMPIGAFRRRSKSSSSLQSIRENTYVSKFRRKYKVESVKRNSTQPTNGSHAVSIKSNSNGEDNEKPVSKIFKKKTTIVVSTDTKTSVVGKGVSSVEIKPREPQRFPKLPKSICTSLPVSNVDRSVLKLASTVNQVVVTDVTSGDLTITFREFDCPESFGNETISDMMNETKVSETKPGPEKSEGQSDSNVPKQISDNVSVADRKTPATKISMNTSKVRIKYTSGSRASHAADHVKVMQKQQRQVQVPQKYMITDQRIYNQNASTMHSHFSSHKKEDNEHTERNVFSHVRTQIQSSSLQLPLNFKKEAQTTVRSQLSLNVKEVGTKPEQTSKEQSLDLGTSKPSEQSTSEDKEQTLTLNNVLPSDQVNSDVDINANVPHALGLVKRAFGEDRSIFVKRASDREKKVQVTEVKMTLDVPNPVYIPRRSPTHSFWSS